jgi:hypothetical protein
MKTLALQLFPVFILTISCQQKCIEQNSFTSKKDTLLIITSKAKGVGVFTPGTIPLNARDTASYFISDIIYPTGIDSLQRSERSVDFVMKYYYDYKRGLDRLLRYVNEDIEYNYLDTTRCLSEKQCQINILEGYLDGERVLIVDENNNWDLSDDSIRNVDEIELDDPDDFVEFVYRIYNGKEVVVEKSWLGFRVIDGRVFWGKREHIVAEFAIDDKTYKIGIGRPNAYDFVYDYESMTPYLLQFFALDDTAVEYDFLRSNFYQLGQYINLNNQYYCLQQLSRDGKELTLVKESDFPSKTGTQIGMIAPVFCCVTQNGDTIRSENLKDKGLMIVNMCGCGGDYESIQAYFDIEKEFGEEYHVIGVDSQDVGVSSGILINSDIPFNEQFYKDYRQMYCSRMIYVINKDYRIEAKFLSQEWKEFHEEQKATTNYN